jgi:hypothetical protein
LTHCAADNAQKSRNDSVDALPLAGRIIAILRCEELHTVVNPLVLENQLVPTASTAVIQNIRFSGTPNGVQTPTR